MKLSNEVKIAATAILALVLLFFGMKFLKGIDIFSDDTSYEMKFENIDGLSASAPIYANGFKVGSVKSIDYDYNKPGDITVEVGIDKDMQIPKDTKAEIVSDLMGNVQINLILGNVASGVVPAQGVIDGRINNGALGEVKNMVPAIQQMLPKLDSILSSVNTLLADPALAASLHNVQKITADLTTSTRELNQLLATANQELPSLAGKANNLMDHADGALVGAGGLMTNANQLVTNMDKKVQQVDIAATMQKVNTTLQNMNELTAKLNSNEGSIGLLMNDPGLYNNLNSTMQSADSLLINLREHPKRYVHFSLFGRKDK